MSTFDGFIKEFPAIRVDYFRTLPGKAPPLACFLSHVHSDHLLGLESLKSPFVYCSVATRRLLLRIEKYPHRMNFAKGILEARKQHYKHLRLILRPVPLQTPTKIELGAKKSINVTLFDANHCPGAVMFLIEGDGQAVLYTGDIRAEPWWVNSIVRNPILLPYTCGAKALDCIYLDTTFASHDDIYQHFPTKAEGLVELLRQIKTFPSTTKFYFRAWTLGYEDVWIALASMLDSKVHLDDYQLRLYGSLLDESGQGLNIADGPALTGFQKGNQIQSGCLDSDWQTRLHSCEPGTECHSRLSKEEKIIWITPIISRLKDGTEILEIGAGGGGGDLYQASEIDPIDESGTAALDALCQNIIPDIKAREAVRNAFAGLSTRNRLKFSIDSLGLATETVISLKVFIEALTTKERDEQVESTKHRGHLKSDTIHFPYSRHASYEELCDLVSRFGPKDICPCTVDLDTWSQELSIESLFGKYCSEQQFYYDRQNRQFSSERQSELNASRKRKRSSEQCYSPERSPSMNEAYKTANTSFGTTKSRRGQAMKAMGTGSPTEQPRIPAKTSSTTAAEPDAPRQAQERAGVFQESQHQLEAIKTAFRGLNGGSDFISIARREQGILPSGTDQSTDASERPQEDSQISISTSVFDSQQMDIVGGAFNKHEDFPASQLDGMDEYVHATGRRETNGSEKQMTSRSTRSTSRRAAFEAARRCLRHNDSSAWDEVGTSAIGRQTHSDDEAEL